MVHIIHCTVVDMCDHLMHSENFSSCVMDETMEHDNKAHALKVPNKTNRKFKSHRGP